MTELLHDSGVTETALLARSDQASAMLDICAWLEHLQDEEARSGAQRATRDSHDPKRHVIVSLSRSRGNAEDQQRLATALLWYADRGWEIRDLRRSSTSGDLEELAVYLLHTFRFSRGYTAFMSPPTELGQVPDFVVVTGRGALLAFPSLRSPASSDSLITVRPGQVCSAIEEWADLTIASSEVLLNVATQESYEWESLLHKTDLRVGDRLQMRELFTTLSEPASLTRLEYEEERFSGSELELVMRMHTDRVEAMLDQLGRYRFMNVAELSSVERYIATGKRERHGVQATPAQVTEQVNREIDWLETYPNYHLGLTDVPTSLGFMVKAGKVLFEVIRRPSSHSAGAGHVTVESEALSHVFLHQFEQIWDSIPLVLRRQDRVAEFLKERLRDSPYVAHTS